jgi:hypothetical protein
MAIGLPLVLKPTEYDHKVAARLIDRQPYFDRLITKQS